MKRVFPSNMSQLQHYLALVAGGLSALTLVFFALASGSGMPWFAAFGLLGVASLSRYWLKWSLWLDGGLALLGAVLIIDVLPVLPPTPVFFWITLVGVWVFSWLFVERLTRAINKKTVSARLGFIVPLIFGAALLLVWEAVTRGAGIPTILLPPPTMIWQRLITSLPTLVADFQQTFLKAVLIGYALGCGSGFLVAILIDRSPFLKRGLLPMGNFVSALPIIGIAPIMVTWFGFDWQSKAAVVAIMTFFPMLVNTVAGLNASGSMERDMMRTYAASYGQTLIKLRLPAAAPFIFNALKINSTLALIGAIVAEFFGTPVVGMGFRISTEVGKMNVDMVWAEIAMAAIAGSAFYGVVTLIERAVTFWHPSVRGGRA